MTAACPPISAPESCARSAFRPWAGWRWAAERAVGRSPACSWRCDTARRRTKTMNDRPTAVNTELPTSHPRVVSRDEWEEAWQQLLAQKKSLTRARDALAAERRRMPWLAVEKDYVFDGPVGKASLLDLFDGRQQLIVYRAFHEPGVFGWPDHAC